MVYLGTIRRHFSSLYSSLPFFDYQTTAYIMISSEDFNLDYAVDCFTEVKCLHEQYEHNYGAASHREGTSLKMQPAKYLFFNPRVIVIKTKDVRDENVDVDTVHPQRPLYFNAAKMNAEGLLDFSQQDEEDFDGDWSQKVAQKGWTFYMKTLFKDVVGILDDTYLAVLAIKGAQDEALQQRLHMKQSSRRLQRLLGSAFWDPTTTQWLHMALTKDMPKPYEAVYKAVLRCMESCVTPAVLETMTSPLMPSPWGKIRAAGSMMMTTTDGGAGGRGGNEIKSAIWDTFEAALASSPPPIKMADDVVFVLAPNSVGQCFREGTRPHRIFQDFAKMARLVAVTCARNETMRAVSIVKALINATKEKIQQVKSEPGTKRVVLLGMDVGSLVAIYASVDAGVHGIVCLGYPTRSMAGRIGAGLISSGAPTFIALGQCANQSTVRDVEEYRARMAAKSALLVVGGGDDLLRVGHKVKRKFSVTQSVVDRCIVNEAGRFLKETLAAPADYYRKRPLLMSDCGGPVRTAVRPYSAIPTQHAIRITPSLEPPAKKGNYASKTPSNPNSQPPPLPPLPPPPPPPSPLPTQVPSNTAGFSKTHPPPPYNKAPAPQSLSALKEQLKESDHGYAIPNSIGLLAPPMAAIPPSANPPSQTSARTTFSAPLITNVGMKIGECSLIPTRKKSVSGGSGNVGSGGSSSGYAGSGGSSSGYAGNQSVGSATTGTQGVSFGGSQTSGSGFKGNQASQPGLIRGNQASQPGVIRGNQPSQAAGFRGNQASHQVDVFNKGNHHQPSGSGIGGNKNVSPCPMGMDSLRALLMNKNGEPLRSQLEIRPVSSSARSTTYQQPRGIVKFSKATISRVTMIEEVNIDDD